MEIRLAREEDIETIRSLLIAANLPATDLRKVSLAAFFVGDDDPQMIVGCIGLEAYDDVGLIRSLVVRPHARSAGIGKALVSTVEEVAALRGVKRLYLLTTTAPQFFERHRYQTVERDLAPDAIRKTTQFVELCPASATLMAKYLDFSG
ncbi:arsenic resistance N-acetyltransferase ArsN2 [Paraburkholderia sp. DHOC27]|uniref:arsenic resistance N-acetyltransferase ArsN2 n=1 Tax=Paraburkholderia sp. DHOC27 TaxID=2303330 RepID=UPI000E3BECC1|nr:arsenic resistance N-acetyltransferase ArsN2 [Paraburkholderia sp. DHOC27]RFU44443.1 GNAT family N-acetyltransferase [Paraburkholderia sp. DHOC27]